jgi:hypothetical protein
MVSFRVCRPTNSDLLAFVKNVLYVEKVTIITRTINHYIEINDNQPNKVLNALQQYLCKIPNDIDKHVHKLCEHIESGKFKQVRELLYILMVKNVSPIHIIKMITIQLRSHDVTRLAAISSHNLIHSERAIYHLEAFTTHCIAVHATNKSRRTKNKK